MLLGDMLKGRHYVVIKGSKDKTFYKGDKIYILDNGDIMNNNAGGWLSLKESKKYFKTVEITDDVAYLKKRIEDKKKELEKEIALLEGILGNG